MIKQLGEKHNLPLKTGFNGTKGFFVQLALNRDQHIDHKTLPSEFLKVVKVRSAVCFTTVDLVSINKKPKVTLSPAVEEVSLYLLCFSFSLFLFFLFVFLFALFVIVVVVVQLFV